jgi:lipoyl(octanoyl) transferase
VQTLLRNLGRIDYQTSLIAMRQFTEQRTGETPDEIWFLEHPAVFTMGQAAKPEHLLNTGQTPVIYVERGGQVTYHGPGQLVAYLMLDLRRLRHNDKAMTVKNLVCQLEQSLIDTLAQFGLTSARKTGAPGVYIQDPTSDTVGAKIAALGLKIRKNCCFHGIALNVDMDLEPFSRINPCGYADLAVTDIRAELHNTIQTAAQKTASGAVNSPKYQLMQTAQENLAHNLMIQLGLSLQVAALNTSTFSPTTPLFKVDHETN